MDFQKMADAAGPFIIAIGLKFSAPSSSGSSAAG